MRVELKQPRGNILKDPSRFKVLACGRRWGKTYLGIMYLHPPKIEPEGFSWFVAPTYRQAKRIAWPVLKKLHRAWGWHDQVIYSEVDLSATLPNQHKIMLMGADNEDSLRGVGLRRIVMDEYAYMKPNVWGEVIRPMLSDYNAPALFTGTPDGLNHFYDLYERGQLSDADWNSWQYKSIEGGYIDADEIEAARRDLDSRTFRTEYEASFETVSNRVYYSFNRNLHDDKRDDINHLPIIVGMDFNVSKMCACLGRRIGKDHVHWFDQVVLKDSNTFEMAEILKKKCPGAIVYPDPAGSSRSTSGTKSDHQILRDNGFIVVARKAHPPVKDRVNAVNSRFMSQAGDIRMTIDVEVCKELVTDLERVTWKGSDIDKTDMARTHMSDAMGYAVEYLWPINRGFVGSIMR